MKKVLSTPVQSKAIRPYSLSAKLLIMLAVILAFCPNLAFALLLSSGSNDEVAHANPATEAQPADLELPANTNFDQAHHLDKVTDFHLFLTLRDTIGLDSNIFMTDTFDRQHLGDAVSKQLKTIWSTSPIAFFGENHDNPISELVKTGLIAAAKEDRFILFCEGYDKDVAQNGFMGLEPPNGNMFASSLLLYTYTSLADEEVDLSSATMRHQLRFSPAFSMIDHRFLKDLLFNPPFQDSFKALDAHPSYPQFAELHRRICDQLGSGDISGSDILDIMYESASFFSQRKHLALALAKTHDLGTRLGTTSLRQLVDDIFERPTHELRGRFHEEFLVDFRNKCWAKHIAKVVLQNPNRKFVILVGKNHLDGLKTDLVSALNNENAIIISPVTPG